MPAMLRGGMLGRTGMVLGVPVPPPGRMRTLTARTENRDAALAGYAGADARPTEDNRRGGEGLLRRLVSHDHTDIRVLSLYAFSAF